MSFYSDKYGPVSTPVVNKLIHTSRSATEVRAIVLVNHGVIVTEDEDLTVEEAWAELRLLEATTIEDRAEWGTLTLEEINEPYMEGFIVTSGEPYHRS